MDINNLKAAIAEKAGIKLPTLMLVRQLEEGTSNPTPWLSHWDNDKRVRITLHEDVAKQIATTPTMDKLAFKYEVVPATPEREAYSRFVIITPTTVEMTL